MPLNRLCRLLVAATTGAGVLLAVAACGAQGQAARVERPAAVVPGPHLPSGWVVPADSPVTPLYPVGVRELQFSRGADRPLPTTVWYPAAGAAGTGLHRDVAVADGSFPLILFSHGLTGDPGGYQGLLTRWAGAGFVVAAPAYPYTKRGAPTFTRADIPNQPLDASAVISAMLVLGSEADDPFHGHLDSDAIAAAGHSAGGYTTAGLLSSARDERVRAAIIIAGAGMGDAPFVGSPTPVLFLHGDADPVVTYTRGMATYRRVPWPKAFVTMHGQGHGEYLQPNRTGFGVAVRTGIDFLRWALLSDQAAGNRLPADATNPEVSWVDDER